jgi:aminomethyltransferase
MGEIEVAGKDVVRFLNHVLVNEVSRAGIGGATYSPMCRDDGGVVDDLISYQLSDEVFLLCVNASNVDEDFSWLCNLSSGFDCELRNLSDHYGLLAVQGPNAINLLQQLADFDLAAIKRFRFVRDRVGRAAVLCSRTGYTGEDGFELYCPVAELGALAEEIMNLGEPNGLRLVGLGARDSLRLEVGYPLYGHEINHEITPLQAGLAWTIGWDKKDFMGRRALLEEKTKGVQRRIIHFTLNGRRIAREGDCVWVEGEAVGRVISGAFSPMIGQPIGSALIDSDSTKKSLYVDLRGTKVPLLVKKPPLHKPVETTST